MTRVLVTGGNGFLGQACVNALLEAGHSVLSLSRSARAPEGAIPIACDLLDHDAMRAAVRVADAECLIHAAWEADARARWNSPTNLDWVSSSFALARSFAEAGGKRFVFVGSCAEYDWSQPILAEATTPLRPSTLYGAAKAATGIALTAAAPSLGLNFAWARIFFCYGPAEPRGRLLPDLVAELSAGQPIACTDGRQERDFLHSADVGAALALVAMSGIDGAVNIGSGEAVPVKRLISEVAGLVGNASLIEMGARPRAPGDPPRLVAEVSRLAALGFRPRFDLSAGLRDAVHAQLSQASSAP